MTEENTSQEENTIKFEGRKSFEVKIRPAKGGGIEKAIFIGGELLDWQVDINSLVDAMKMGPMYVKEVQRDIEKHFVESVSDFIGRKVNADDIKKAIKDGYI
jgi:carbon monoxide dehydrogenase subunit G